jgi:hypothetical protein
MNYFDIFEIVPLQTEQKDIGFGIPPAIDGSADPPFEVRLTTEDEDMAVEAAANKNQIKVFFKRHTQKSCHKRHILLSHLSIELSQYHTTTISFYYANTWNFFLF